MQTRLTVSLVVTVGRGTFLVCRHCSSIDALYRPVIVDQLIVIGVKQTSEFVQLFQEDDEKLNNEKKKCPDDVDVFEIIY